MFTFGIIALLMIIGLAGIRTIYIARNATPDPPLSELASSLEWNLQTTDDGNSFLKGKYYGYFYQLSVLPSGESRLRIEIQIHLKKPTNQSFFLEVKSSAPGTFWDRTEISPVDRQYLQGRLDDDFLLQSRKEWIEGMELEGNGEQISLHFYEDELSQSRIRKLVKVLSEFAKRIEKA